MKLDSGATVFSALLLGLGGEAVVLFAGQSALGGVLLLAGAGVLIGALWKEKADPSAPSADLTGRKALALLAGILLVAVLLRRLQIATIPWGLNNDEGIEGLIACRFLVGERITPFSSIGLSRETLYHVLLMPLFTILGPGIGSMRLLSFLCGTGAVALAYLAGRELFSRRAGLLAAFLLAVSPWHILYSRTGFRNILLPVFLLAVLFAFQRALTGRKPIFFVLTGGLLAAGMYSYTSFRIIPVALVAWALARRWLRKPVLTWKQAGLAAGTFLFLMIPQMASALGDPAGFITRGGYVLTQTPDASVPQNLLFSALMPVLYPSRFGIMQSRWFFGDGVSLVYAAVGRTPETLVSGVVMIFGVVFTALRFLRRRGEGEGMILVLYVLTVLSVGLAGPSLTRMIGALPLLCLMGARFLEAVLDPGRTILPRRVREGTVAVLLCAAAALGYEQYFLRAGRSPRAMFYYAAPQTIMGLYAASRAVDHPVHVLYSEQPETLRFLTFTRQQLIDLQHEPEGLDMERVRQALGHQEFVLESHRRFLPVFTALAEAFPWADATILRDARHNPEVPVAYVLDMDPSKKPGEKSGPPGAVGPGSGPEVSEPGR